MTNRAAKVAPHIGAVLLASATLVTVQLHAASAADECLAKPTGGGAGQHWYYHLDRATKRQCWYLRDGATASNATTAALPQTASDSRQAAATGRNARLSSSTANAHAELPASDASGEDDARLAAAAPAPDDATAAQSAVTPSAPPASPSAITSRWPDGSEAPATVGPSPSQSTFAPTLIPKTDPVVTADATTSQAAAPEPVSETEPAAAPITVTESPSRTFLLACLAALAFAGFLVSLGWGRIKARRHIRLDTDQPRGPRWPDEMPDNPMSPPWQQPQAQDLDHVQALPANGGPAARPRRPRIGIEPVRAHVAAPRNDLSEIEDLLSQYAGQRSNG